MFTAFACGLVVVGIVYVGAMGYAVARFLVEVRAFIERDDEGNRLNQAGPPEAWEFWSEP